MPTARSAAAAATVQGVVYVMGGQPLDGDLPPLDKVEAYHPSTSTLLAWRPRAPMPKPRAFTNGAVAIDGQIYVTGGYGMDDQGLLVPTSNLFRYTPATNQWSTRTPMPRATAAGASVAINGQLYVYVVHGPEASPSAELYRYDPVTEQWTERAEPPVVQPGATAAAAAGKMYVIGHGKGKSTPLGTVTAYNPSTNTWTTRASLLTARTGATARAIDGLIYVTGGAGGPNTILASTEVYDPATNSWSGRADLPTPRVWAASATAGGRLYVIGGYGGLRVNEMYVP
jgi:N-acetylneuraminic acid mutarotase